MTARNETTGEPKAPTREGQKPSSLASEPAPHLDLSTITINAKTGQILKIESVDDRGTRHELSDDEKAILIKQAGKATLQDVIEQAFEAGIACMIGAEPGEDDSPESEENMNLRRLLLQPLIEESAVKHLMQRDVLSRAIVGTLISQAVHSRTPHRESGPAQQRSKGSASKSRQRNQSPERMQK
jgi:hypothetical protein